MKLWKIYTKQEQEYIDLMNGKTLVFNKNYSSFAEEIDPDLQHTYKWLAKQLKVPSKYEFPFQLLHTVEGSTDPMNNKFFGIYNPGDYIIVIFDIDDKLVRLYDDDLFIICLNHGYLSLSEAEDLEWENYIKFFPELGINPRKLFNDDYLNSLNNSQRNLANTYLKAVYASWNRIFNLYLKPSEWIVTVDKTIVGMTWTLHKDQISDIINFSVSESELKNYYDE